VVIYFVPIIRVTKYRVTPFNEKKKHKKKEKGKKEKRENATIISLSIKTIISLAIGLSVNNFYSSSGTGARVRRL